MVQEKNSENIFLNPGLVNISCDPAANPQGTYLTQKFKAAFHSSTLALSVGYAYANNKNRMTSCAIHVLKDMISSAPAVLVGSKSTHGTFLKHVLLNIYCKSHINKPY